MACGSCWPWRARSPPTSAAGASSSSGTGCGPWPAWSAAASGRLRLTSRNGRDITASYPDLQPLAEALAGHRVVLDGEIVAFAAGRPDFGLLQQRMHVADAARARRLARRVPVALVVFDLLYLDGRLTMPQPYVERRRRLQALHLEGNPTATAEGRLRQPSWRGLRPDKEPGDVVTEW